MRTQNSSPAPVASRCDEPLCSAGHRRKRIGAESLLQPSCQRITEANKPPVWFRKGQYFIPDRIVGAPFNHEPFFATLGMVHKGSVGKTEAADRAGFVDDIHDTAGVQPPHAKTTRQNRNSRSRRNRSARPAELQPTDVEHLPMPECGRSGFI